MKLKLLIGLLLVVGIGYGCYLWGWFQGVYYESAASAVVHGEIDLTTVKFLKGQNYKNALSLIETDLRSQQSALNGFRKHPPKVFASEIEKWATRINQYQPDIFSAPEASEPPSRSAPR